MFSTSKCNYEESVQLNTETKEEDKFSREKFLELSIKELRAMFQSGIDRSKNTKDKEGENEVPPQKTYMKNLSTFCQT